MRYISLIYAVLLGFFFTCIQAPAATISPATPSYNDEAVNIAVEYAHSQLKYAEHLSGGFVGHAEKSGNIIPVCVLSAVKDKKTSKYREEDYLIFVDKNSKVIVQSYTIQLNDKSMSQINPETLKMYKENCGDGDDAVAVEGPRN